MRYEKSVAAFVLLTCSALAPGKDKKKVTLPDQVLNAETVLVLIDPDAGVAPDAPLANPAARDDVESALINWGRFRFANDVSTADLVITVRKGNGKVAQDTIGGVPVNNRPIVFQRTESGGGLGAGRGTPSAAGDPASPPAPDPMPQVEVGPAQDTFAVFIGKRSHPLDTAAVWRYTAKDGLRSHDVPAVDEFRKAITQAEKERARKP